MHSRLSGSELSKQRRLSERNVVDKFDDVESDQRQIVSDKASPPSSKGPTDLRRVLNRFADSDANKIWTKSDRHLIVDDRHNKVSSRNRRIVSTSPERTDSVGIRIVRKISDDMNIIPQKLSDASKDQSRTLSHDSKDTKPRKTVMSSIGPLPPRQEEEDSRKRLKKRIKLKRNYAPTEAKNVASE